MMNPNTRIRTIMRKHKLSYRDAAHILGLPMQGRSCSTLAAWLADPGAARYRAAPPYAADALETGARYIGRNRP